MLAIVLVMIGATGASSGLMLWGTAGTIIGGHDTMHAIGIWSMIIGVILTAIGTVLYRKNEAALEAAARR
jgi:hypothetical protein